MQAEWALFGGHVETMAGARSASAVAIAGGRFIAVGEEDEVRAACGPDTQISDLAGRTMLPGFIDTHMHFEKIAREMAMVQLDGVRSLAELLDAVRSAAARAPAGEWIRSFGDDGAWHERQLPAGRLPSREELDRATPAHPVFLYRGPDLAILNSAAAALLEPRLAEDGSTWDSSSGVLRGRQARVLEAELPPDSPQRQLDRLADASAQLLRMGVTTIVDPGLPGAFERSWELYRSAQASGRVPQRLYLMNRLDPRREFRDELARLEEGPALPRDGDDRLRAWSVKLILDGEFDNAWMRPGESDRDDGLRRYDRAEIDTVVALCAQRQWPLCIHAMGGGAIGCVIDAVADAVADGAEFAASQVSIAHAFLASPGDIRACAELGIAISVQPLLAYVFAEEMKAAWGELAESANPLATMVRTGDLVAGGSDTLPCEPLRGARYAVERRSREGQMLGTDKAIDARDAISLFTERAAGYIQRDDLGAVAAGRVADFALWGENPLQTPPERWLDIPVSLAAIGGAAVWGE